MDIMLSIIVPTYGQEKYIGQTLDSILMQKTKYSYEVLVGEDASPDNTRAVLKKYEKQYPGKFQMIYRDVNSRTLGISNVGDLKKRAQGKYWITLEGDDYWTDENKIEKQLTFLESHPDYIAISHNCIVVDEDSNPTKEKYPECKDEEYTIDHYLNNILPGQLATVMTRNYYKENLFDLSILMKRLSPGDRLLYFALVTHGKIHCIQEQMSAYRHVTNSGTSFSANYKFDFNKGEHWHKELLNYAYSLNNRKAANVAETLYFTYLVQAYKGHFIKLKDVRKYSKLLRHRFKVPFRYLKRYFYIKTHKGLYG